MSLKEVKKVREAVAKHVADALNKTRVYLSFTDGNEAAQGKLRDGEFLSILEDTTERVLRHLGHERENFVRNPGGQGTRAARRVAKA